MTETQQARAVLPGIELARILNNAHAMVPARAQHQHLSLNIGVGFVSAGGSDQYIAGIDYAEAQTEGNVNRGIALSRDSVSDMERIARLEGKKDNVILTLEGETLTLTYQTEGGKTEQHVAEDTRDFEAEVWNAILDLMQGPYEEMFPRYAAFSPTLFARLAKVKGEGTEVMDIYWTPEGRPALVKQGRSFVALVMPLDRSRSRKYCPDGHWPEPDSA